MSGVYKYQSFYRDCPYRWTDASEISGTNCYCDEEAGTRLRHLLKDCREDRIHFIDSGNYHYLTKFFLEEIRSPFQLVVFDNHTDMQQPAFGEILSCGGWIDSAIRELPLLKRVILAGPDEKAFMEAEEDSRRIVRLISRERLQRTRPALRGELLTEELDPELPVYLSIDKDILCGRDAKTSWSQGVLSLEELTEIVGELLRYVGMEDFLGADICGECDPEDPAGGERNDIANRKLLECIAGTGSAELL